MRDQHAGSEAAGALTIDPAKEAAVTGEPIVLMGYATGLAAHSGAHR